MKCKHDLIECEVAVGADGMCPLCLAKDLKDMTGAYQRLCEQNTNLQAILATINELSEK